MKKFLLVLFFCLCVVMIGYGLTLPVLPFYIERVVLAKGMSLPEVSFQVGLLTGIFALMQFLFAPLWGKWSDQLGRRPLFLIGLGGFAISMVLFGMGTSLLMLYAARIVGGVLSAAVLPIANAYVSDVTSEKDRGRAMAWLGSAIGLGVAVGPALSAFLSRLELHLTYRFGHLSVDNLSIPFFAGALFSLLALGLAMRWLPESLKKPNVELPAQWTHRENASKPTGWLIPGWLGPFLVLSFVAQFALTAFEGTFALHAKKMTQFGPSEMGLVFMVCGFVMAAGQGTVVVWLIGRLGEGAILPAGFAMMGMGLAMLMTTRKMAIILLYVALLAFGMALVIPSLATLVSKRAGNRAGAVFGQLTAAYNLGQASGPAVGGVLFAWRIHAPYLLTALLLVTTAAYTAIFRLYGSE